VTYCSGNQEKAQQAPVGGYSHGRAIFECLQILNPLPQEPGARSEARLGAYAPLVAQGLQHSTRAMCREEGYKHPARCAPPLPALKPPPRLRAPHSTPAWSSPTPSSRRGLLSNIHALSLSTHQKRVSGAGGLGQSRRVGLGSAQRARRPQVGVGQRGMCTTPQAPQGGPLREGLIHSLHACRECVRG